MGSSVLGDAAMVVDCDVAAMEQLVLAGHVDEPQQLRAAVEAGLDSAEVPLVVAFERTVGRLDVLAGDTEAGLRHLQGALESARDHGLLYDECLCRRPDVSRRRGRRGEGRPRRAGSTAGLGPALKCGRRPSPVATGVSIAAGMGTEHRPR